MLDYYGKRRVVPGIAFSRSLPLQDESIIYTKIYPVLELNLTQINFITGMQNKSANTINDQSETPSSRRLRIQELCRKHGIKSEIDNSMEGKASIMFTNKTSETPTNLPLSESEDAAATALHYYNLRKGH